MARTNDGTSYLKEVGKIKKEVDFRKRVDKLKLVLISFLAFSFVVFLVIAGLAVLNEGVGTFVSTLESINLFYFFLALVVILLADLMMFPKWQFFTRRLGVRISWKKNLLVYLSMFAMELTPGRWGRAVVSFTLNRITGKDFGATFPAVVADVFTDFLGFALLSLIAIFFVGSKYIISSLVIMILLLIPFAFMFHKTPFRLFKRALSRVSFMKTFFEVGEMYFENNTKLGGGIYAYSLLYTLPAMFMNSVAFYLIVYSFGIPLNILYLPVIVFIYTSSALFGMITGVPGSIGATETALIAYLVAFLGGLGVTFGIAAAITIFTRIANLWFVEAFGFAAMAYTFRYWKK